MKFTPTPSTPFAHFHKPTCFAVFTSTLALASALYAQPGGPLPAGKTLSSVDTTFIQQFNADLGANGDFSMSSIGARYNLLHSLGEGRAIGGSLGYTADFYDFGGTFSPKGAAPGPFDPWDTIHTYSLTGMYMTPLGHDWKFRIAPSISLSGESDASASDSMIYGGIFTFTREFSDTLTLGFGGGVFSELEETNGFPIIAVRWEFAPGWTLQNPLRPGPAGPAGLEVSYKMDDWDFGLGATFRSFRFRVDDTFNSNGIGEHTSVPLFLRASRPITQSLNLDLYGGVLLGGTVKWENSNGGELLDEDFDPAPFLAISLTGRF